MNVGLNGWVNVGLNGWVNAWVNVGLNGWVNGLWLGCEWLVGCCVISIRSVGFVDGGGRAL